MEGLYKSLKKYRSRNQLEVIFSFSHFANFSDSTIFPFNNRKKEKIGTDKPCPRAITQTIIFQMVSKIKFISSSFWKYSKFPQYFHTKFRAPNFCTLIIILIGINERSALRYLSTIEAKTIVLCGTARGCFIFLD